MSDANPKPAVTGLSPHGSGPGGQRGQRGGASGGQRDGQRRQEIGGRDAGWEGGLGVCGKTRK